MLTGFSYLFCSCEKDIHQVISFLFSNFEKYNSLMSDGNVTCVATDDSRGALGVAGGRGELLLYLHDPELDSN